MQSIDLIAESTWQKSQWIKTRSIEILLEQIKNKWKKASFTCETITKGLVLLIGISEVEEKECSS